MKLSLTIVLLVTAFLVLSCSEDEATPDADSSLTAAQLTASQNAECTELGDFYWSIGSASGVLVEASQGSGSVLKTTDMRIASASKLLFSAYVAEKLSGSLSASIIQGLNFTSGYVSMNFCFPAETVGACFTRNPNDTYSASEDGKFYYGPGHMQDIAANDLSLSSMDKTAFATEIQSVLGSYLDLSFGSVLAAGGMRSNPEAYSELLQKIVNNEYQISSLLGTQAICTNPSVCPSTASYTPVPSNESWSYSLGHWIEDDSQVGDGAFSSPGLFGFYPWIDSTKTYWGVLAREDTSADAYYQSVQCGRLIRKAFLTGQQQ